MRLEVLAVARTCVFTFAQARDLFCVGRSFDFERLLIWALLSSNTCPKKSLWRWVWTPYPYEEYSGPQSLTSLSSWWDEAAQPARVCWCSILPFYPGMNHVLSRMCNHHAVCCRNSAFLLLLFSVSDDVNKRTLLISTSLSYYSSAFKPGGETTDYLRTLEQKQNPTGGRDKLEKRGCSCSICSILAYVYLTSLFTS